jgi:hypothetical protein
MNRIHLALLATLTAGVAHADVAPPPGKKRVSIDYVFSTETDFKNYMFFAVIGGEADWSKRLEIKPGKPAKLPGADRGGRARLGWLIAVPATAEKDFTSADEFKAAAVAKKIPGTVQADVGLDSLGILAERDKRTVIDRKYRIDRIDEKKGIVLIDAEPKGPTEEPKRPGGLGRAEILAGCCAALGLAGLGVWLVRRGRGEWMK